VFDHRLPFPDWLEVTLPTTLAKHAFATLRDRASASSAVTLACLSIISTADAGVRLALLLQLDLPGHFSIFWLAAHFVVSVQNRSLPFQIGCTSTPRSNR